MHLLTNHTELFSLEDGWKLECSFLETKHKELMKQDSAKLTRTRRCGTVAKFLDRTDTGRTEKIQNLIRGRISKVLFGAPVGND